MFCCCTYVDMIIVVTRAVCLWRICVRHVCVGGGGGWTLFALFKSILLCVTNSLRIHGFHHKLTLTTFAAQCVHFGHQSKRTWLLFEENVGLQDVWRCLNDGRSKRMKACKMSDGVSMMVIRREWRHARCLTMSWWLSKHNTLVNEVFNTYACR